MRKGTESGKFNPLWSEAIGRANIIKAHLRIDKASVADADADAAATALVLKRRDFYHLVRVFQAHRSKPRPRRASGSVDHVIADTISRTGADAPLGEIVRAAQASAREN